MNRRTRSVFHLAMCAAVTTAGAQSPAQQDVQPQIAWATSATSYRGQTGKALNVFCPPITTRGGQIWGVDIYTDDSSICMAAVHTLKSFDHLRGGTVFFQVEPAQEGYEGDTRRGIRGEPWGSFGGGLRILAAVPGRKLSEISDTTPMEVSWLSSARHLRGTSGTERVVYCAKGGSPQPVWGNGIYADDSSICTAAVHAGLITFANGGGVTLRTEPGREGYKASTKNGVRTLSWEKWDASFSFPRRQIAVAQFVAGVDPPPPQPRLAGTVGNTVLSIRLPVARGTAGEHVLEWTTSGQAWRAQPQVMVTAWCPPAGRESRVWGSGDYTDDSSICTAAVHALATFDFATGGTVYFTRAPGLDAYVGDTRRGVVTTQFDTFPSSFRIVGGVPGKRAAEVTDSTLVEISWTTSTVHLRGTTRERRMLCPPEGRVFPVWGNDVYAEKSSVCGAAVHAGLITRAMGGQVTVQPGPVRTEFGGITRNEVTTNALMSAAATFTFRR